MTTTTSRKNSHENHRYLVDTLLSLPVKNLEARVSQLESDIKVRSSISDQTLSKLGTSRLAVEDKLCRLQYSEVAGSSSSNQASFAAQALRIDTMIFDEIRACFRDTFELREKLTQAKEELSLASSKFGLVSKALSKGGQVRRGRAK